MPSASSQAMLAVTLQHPLAVFTAQALGSRLLLLGHTAALLKTSYANILLTQVTQFVKTFIPATYTMQPGSGSEVWYNSVQKHFSLSLALVHLPQHFTQPDLKYPLSVCIFLP